MIWLTWRQARVQAISVFAGLAFITVVLLVTRPALEATSEFSDDEALYTATLLAMYLLPAVLGVFWGVPMVSRELETGTHNVAWNQTVTRARWLGTRLGAGALTAMVATGLLSLVVSWWASPIDAIAGTDPEASFEPRVAPLAFAARGIAPIGYAAFASVLGVVLGMLLRRTLAAMAVTLVVFTAVQVLVPTLVRGHALPATEETVVITMDNIRGLSGRDGMLNKLTVEQPAGAWVLANETVDANGDVAATLPNLSGCLPPPPTDRGAAPPDRIGVEQCFDRLTELGYRQRITYQPASHFWPLQLIETAFFLALSGLLGWFCLRRIRLLH